MKKMLIMQLQVGLRGRGGVSWFGFLSGHSIEGLLIVSRFINTVESRNACLQFYSQRQDGAHQPALLGQ